MIILDIGRTEDGRCQDRRQQDRPFEIGNGKQQHRGNETQPGNRKSEVFNAALCKPNDADGGHNDQGQRHRNTMTDWWMKFNRLQHRSGSRTNVDAAGLIPEPLSMRSERSAGLDPPLGR